jgi:hypothetical protein
MERDRHTPLKTDDAQAWTKVVTPCPPLSSMSKSQAVSFDTAYISDGTHRTGPIGNVVIQFEEVCLGLG